MILSIGGLTTMGGKGVYGWSRRSAKQILADMFDTPDLAWFQ